MKVLCISLIFCCFLVACHSTTKENVSKNKLSVTKTELSKTFYKQLVGHIGNSEITMDLVRHDSVMSGYYYYNNIGIPISIFGKITSSNRVDLLESVEENANTHFKGKFISSDALNGNWINSITNKSFPFQLKENNEASKRLLIKYYRNENCKNKDQNIKKKRGDYVLSTDTLCSYIELYSPLILTNNQNTNKLINSAIARSICSYDKGYKSINDFLNSIEQLPSDEYLTLSISFDIITNKDGILCLKKSDSEYSGGMHPYGSVTFLNFDLNTGKEISICDIFKSGYYEKLNYMAEKIFKANNSSEELSWNTPGGHFSFNKKFAIAKGGLILMFELSGSNTFSNGEQKIFIPYNDIVNLIKPNGILKHFLEQHH